MGWQDAPVIQQAPAPAPAPAPASGESWQAAPIVQPAAPMPGMSAQAATYMQSHQGMDPQAVQTAFNELPAANAASAYAQKFHMDPAAVQQAYGTLGHGKTVQQAEQEYIQQAHAQQGVAGSFVAGGLQNRTGYAARIYQTLADIADQAGNADAAEKYRFAAQRALGYQGKGVAGAAGSIAANPMTYLGAKNAGPAGQLAAGADSLNTMAGESVRTEEAVKEGRMGAGAALGDIGAQGAIDYAANRVMQRGIAPGIGTQISKKIANPLLQKLSQYAGTGAAEYLTGAGRQVGENAARKYSGLNPNQELLEGANTAGLMQAGQSLAGKAVHEEVAPRVHPLIERLRSGGTAAKETPQVAQPHAEPGNGQQQGAEQGEPVHAQDNRPNPREAYANLVGQLGDEADRWKQQAETQRQRQQDAVAVAGQPAPAAAEAPVPERATGEHPARISGGQDLADYVNRISGDNADIIGHMTANQGFVKALVPIDQLHNLGGTQEDVVAAKAKEPQKNPAVTLPSGAGGEGHLDVWDGNHAVEAARQRGATHAEAYVPESMVGKNGIEPVRAADKTTHTSQQVQTERPQMFGARKGTVAVPDALNKLVQRDVAPAVSRTASNAKASLDAVNRFAGTGLNLSETSRDTAISLRENEAGHEVNQARMETELKPYRDELEKLTPDQRAQWVDDAEQHGMSGHPKLWGLELLNRKWNKANAEEGKQYGLDTSKWKADWIGRLAVFPQGQESGPGGKTRGSIAGSQKFRLARDYDTFSEFKKAVEDAGGKLKYENPADMLLAKQMEVRRSIEARKQMYQQEKAGQLTWRPDSEKSADEPHDTKLDDPLARQTRDVVAPKWMVAKLLNMPHAEAEQYLKSKPWQNKSQTLRPGDEMPQGYAKSGEQVAGTYHADANTAGLFNNLISKGFEKSVPVLSQIANLRRRVTALNLAVPTAHAALTTVSNSVNQLGLAMEAAAKGHWDLAVKNAYRAVNPAAAANFGAELRQQAANPKAHPELEQTVQTSMKGGNKFDLKSVLNETAYQKAKTEWEAGNTAGAAGRGLKAVYHAIEAPLFERYIPNIKAAAKGAAAEIAVRDDLSGKELSRKMALAQDNVDNLLGMVKRSHQFQNRILTDLQDVVFTAPKFAEGTFRFAGAVGRDTAAAVRDLASGKKPAMTPAMYSAAAGILTHMAGSALMQLAYTTATTGKAIWPTSLEDYYKPRTGRKDDAGRDERVSILSPFSALFSAGEHGVGSVTGRVAGLWKAAKAEMTGVDEQGRKLEGVKGRLEYAGKQALPYSVQNLMDLKKRGAVTPDKVAGSMLGMHFSHEGSTPAERAAWGVIHAHYQAQPRDQEEADKSDTMQKLVHEQHTHDPKTGQDIQKALQDGVISNKDVSAIRRRATEKPGLAGLLHSSEIDAKSLMSDVWPKMTPDERKQFRLIVRGKIGRSSLPYAQKQELWKQTDP